MTSPLPKVFPAPTPCPACGYSESTTVCRLCKADKFGPAVFNRVELTDAEIIRECAFYMKIGRWWHETKDGCVVGFFDKLGCTPVDRSEAIHYNPLVIPGQAFELQERACMLVGRGTTMSSPAADDDGPWWRVEIYKSNIYIHPDLKRAICCCVATRPKGKS